MLAVRLEIEGIVQGVGFRWWARERARRHSLAGWVRNRPDGSVEIAVGGEADVVERFIAEVRDGPPGSRIDRVRRVALDPSPSLDSPFSIVR
ncbi:MAG TPA: acylphosphatase [Gemmatimonadaceae bacterium]|nr:acylphosphatase [Gemmatimonadaceae bacterium]